MIYTQTFGSNLYSMVNLMLLYVVASIVTSLLQGFVP